MVASVEGQAATGAAAEGRAGAVAGPVPKGGAAEGGAATAGSVPGGAASVGSPPGGAPPAESPAGGAPPGAGVARGLQAENAALRAENRRLAAEVERLRQALAAMAPAPPGPVQLRLPLDEAEAASSSPLTVDSPLPARIALFRSLFHGRPDAYAAAWTHGGRHGYAPAAQDGAHRRRADLLPLDDRAVARHLAGAQGIGIYPLLHDGGCWLLAVRLEQPSWQADAAAYLAAAAALGVPAALEHAGSDGCARIWTFFAAPVPAARARRLGEAILTRAMALRTAMRLRTFDGLCPDQDSVPVGTLGGSIGLPLQGRAARAGDTLFLDPVTFAPYPDPWRYLSSVRRMSPAAVRELVAASDERPAPARVRLTLGDLAYVDRAGLPPSLLARLWRLASFPKPDLGSGGAGRRSTEDVPTVLHGAEERDGRIGLPRGLADAVRDLLRGRGVAVEEVDARNAGSPVAVAFQGTLSPPQRDAVQALLPHDCGVLCAPAGFGKTVVAAALVAARRTSTLVLVHRQALVDQWRAQVATFLGLPPRVIGRLGAGRHHLGGQVDIALFQSLPAGGELSDVVGRYGQVIVDECHDVPAAPFERVLRACAARYVVGLTAPAARRDGMEPIVAMQCGPVRYRLEAQDPAAARPFAQVVVRRGNGFRGPPPAAPAAIQSWYAALAADGDRNARIVADAAALVAEGRTPLVVTERVDHLELLADRLRQLIDHVVVLRGGMGARRRRAAQETLSDLPEGAPCAIVATGRYLGESSDALRADTLLLALPVAWWGTLAQYAGRVSRPGAGTREARIYDYADMDVPLLAAMYRRRRRAYRSLGFHLREG